MFPKHVSNFVVYTAKQYNVDKAMFVIYFLQCNVRLGVDRSNFKRSKARDKKYLQTYFFHFSIDRKVRVANSCLKRLKNPT